MKRVSVGDKYHYLTVIRRVGTKKNKTPIWLCKCDCGEYTKVSSEHLRNGSVKSCGCYRTTRMRNIQKRENTFVINGDVVTAFDQNGNSFIFDLEDLERVKKYYWSVTPRGYVRNSKHGIFLHRYILNTPDGLVVDHRNHDTTDNRKCNIWSCTQSDNMYNQRRFHRR